MRHTDTDPDADPGWYPDVDRPGTLRWWNGTAWTQLRRRAPEERGGLRAWLSRHVVLTVVVVTLVLFAGSMAVLSVTAFSEDPCDRAAELQRALKDASTQDRLDSARKLAHLRSECALSTLD